MDEPDGDGSDVELSGFREDPVAPDKRPHDESEAEALVQLDCLVGLRVSRAVVKFTAKRRHHTDTARYFERSAPAGIS